LNIELKEKFIEEYRNLVIENQQSIIEAYMFDDKAAEEYLAILDKEGIHKELFNNTLNMTLDEKELEEYMKLQVELSDIIRKVNLKIESISDDMDNIVGKHMEHYREKHIQIFSNFYGEYKPVMDKLHNESKNRLQ